MASVPTSLTNSVAASALGKVRSKELTALKSGSMRPSLSQRLRVGEGGVGAGYLAVPANHAVLRDVEMLEGGLLVVEDIDGNELEFQLGRDFGVEVEIQLTCSPTGIGMLTIVGKRRFEVTDGAGHKFVFSYFPDDDWYGIYSLAQDVCQSSIGGSQVKLIGDGGIVVDGQLLSSQQPWNHDLRDGSELRRESDRLYHVANGTVVAEFLFTSSQARWREIVHTQGNWSFCEVLNGESSLCVELLGLVTLYANECVNCWNTHSFAPGSEIDVALADEQGHCSLYVYRARGSSDLYLYENNSEHPTGICRYVPEHFVGKNGEDLFPAWLYASSNSSLPTGSPGTCLFETLVAVVLLLLLISSYLVAGMAFVVMALFCAGTVWVLVREYVYQIRIFFGM